MEKLFKVFYNPAEGKYVWTEVVDVEVIFLNDFGWCKEIISWKEMLLLLEGQPVHFPASKNHYSKDVCLLSDTPVVTISKSRVVFERNGKLYWGREWNDRGPLKSIWVYLSNPLWWAEGSGAMWKIAFLSLFYWDKFEKGCYLLILYFSLELQRVTRVTLRVTSRVTPNLPCFLGESQRIARVTLHFLKNFFSKCSVTCVTRYNSPKNPANWMLLMVLRVVLRVLLIDFLVTRFCLAFTLA